MESIQGNASRWLVKWMAEAKRFYVCASLMTLLSAGCYIFFSWYLSSYAARWLVLGEITSFKLILAAFFMAGRYLFAHLASIANHKAGEVVVARVKEDLYPKLLNSNHTDSISSTLLVTRVSDDMKPFFSFFIPHALASALVGILMLSVAFGFELWVGISLLLTFAVIPLQMVMIGVGAESLHKKHINLFMKYSAVFYNRLHTVAEIVNLDNLHTQYRFLSEKSKALNKATTQVMQVAILSSAVLELFVTIAIAAVAIYLGLSLLGLMPGSNYGKGYDFHTALFLLMLTPYFFFYLRKFVGAYHDRNKALASAKLLMPHLVGGDDVPIYHNEPLQSLEIKGLSFAYPDSPLKVLNDIALKFPKQGLVLVKGISGSGKSTLLKILSGSLLAQHGSVSVNGHDNLWSMQWLNANTSYMNQFPFIFDGSLGYNVFLDGVVKPEGHYPQFLRKVLVKKESGWDAVLSHNGKQLSGGERQMVALARMMLYPRSVAILDEPTSNLDSETVDTIVETVAGLSHHMLVVVASHEEKFEAVASTILNLNWGEQMDYE